MSAIWGKINLAKESLIQETMLNDMRSHYENTCKIDKYDEILKDNCFMGCGVQFITKEAHDETLPIYDEAHGIIFTADCILDNRDYLINELNVDSKTPDGTLIYQAYLKWGTDCALHLKGLFSFAIYEINKNRLYLYSDYTSSRCLYYYTIGDEVVFSTLIKPILKVCPEIGVNELYLKDYLTAPGLMPNISATETPYEDVFKINPGSYLCIDENGIDEIQYWNPSIDDECKGCHSADSYADRFMDIYKSAVNDALRTEGNVGISMSSGFDSASVGILAAIKLNESGRKLNTYTYVPSEKPTIKCNKTDVTNEQADVEEIARMYPNMVTHFLSNEGRNCLETLPEEIETLEIPFKAIVNMPNLCEIYSKAAEAGCKVVLTGQCGNSTVSHGYIDDVLFDLYSTGHKLTFLSYLNRYSKTVKESRKRALKGCINYFNYSQEILSEAKFNYKPVNKFLAESIVENYPLKERYNASGIYVTTSMPTASTEYRKFLYKSALYTYMGEWETKMGLKYGLVIRDATKDSRIMSFCHHMPYRYFAYKGTPRWLIRRNFKGLFPDYILDFWLRYSVQNSDYLTRLRRDWDSVCMNIISIVDDSEYRSWFDIDMIKDYLDKTTDDSITKTFTQFDDISYIYTLSLFIAHI